MTSPSAPLHRKEKGHNTFLPLRIVIPLYFIGSRSHESNRALHRSTWNEEDLVPKQQINMIYFLAPRSMVIPYSIAFVTAIPGRWETIITTRMQNPYPGCLIPTVTPSLVLYVANYAIHHETKCYGKVWTTD